MICERHFILRQNYTTPANLSMSARKNSSNAFRRKNCLPTAPGCWKRRANWEGAEPAGSGRSAWTETVAVKHRPAGNCLEAIQIASRQFLSLRGNPEHPSGLENCLRAISIASRQYKLPGRSSILVTGT